MWVSLVKAPKIFYCGFASRESQPTEANKSRAHFNSVTLPKIYRGNLFVTKEAFDDVHGNRQAYRYTVRAAMITGEIKTIGDYMQHATFQDARKAIKALIKEEQNNKI